MKRPWLVLHVKPRTEKKVAAFCGAYGYLCCLPLRRHARMVQRRRVTVDLPVFPGYVFVRLAPDEKLRLLQTNLLVRVLRPSSGRVLIHDLRQVVHALRAAPDLVTTASFRAGDRVRVRVGPFQGIEGVVRRSHGHTAVVLNVELLNQALEVSIGPDDLEMVGRKA